MSEQLREDVAALASPSMNGRSIGTPFAAVAAGYLAGRLLEIGMEPLSSDSLLHAVPIEAIRLDGVSGSVVVDGEILARVGDDVSISQGVTGSVRLDSPVTLLRYSNTTSSLPSGVQPDDIDGHILLIERIGDASQSLSLETESLVLELNTASPLAILTVTQDLASFLAQDTTGVVTKYALPGGDQKRFAGSIDAHSVARVFGKAGAATDYDVAVVDTRPGAFSIENVDAGKREFSEFNVIGTLPGSGNASQRILLTAHYDHLGRISGELYPGADDNASGVAVLLEVLRRLSTAPIAAPVDVVFFTGEEHGLLGSRSFANSPPVPLADYGALINIDAIGRPLIDDTAYSSTIFASGLRCWPVIEEALVSAADESTLEVVELADNPILAALDASCNALKAGTGGAPSDQFALVPRGVPGILLTGGLNSDYHQPGDTPDKVDYDRLSKVALLIEDAVRRISESLSSAD